MKKFPRKVSVFWLSYGIFVVLLSGIILTGATLLISWLDAFEASQPIHSAQAVFDEYFAGEKWQEALALAGYETSPWEPEEAAVRQLAEKRKGQEMSFYAAGEEDGWVKYNVVLIKPEDLSDREEGNQELKDATAEMKVNGIPSDKIATISLKKSDKAGSWGFYGYEFAGLELFLEEKVGAEVCIPSHYTLSVNGKEVSEDTAGEKSDHPWNQHLPEGQQGVTLVTYTFEGLLEEPVFSVHDENGSEVPLTHDEASDVFTAQLLYEENPDPAIAERILAGMKEYAAFMQDDGSIGAVARYFDKSSDFYKSTAANPSAFVWDHDGYEFRNEVVDRFYYFDEDTLCCHVSFDQILKLAGLENYTDSLSMTVFAHKVKGTWQIFNCAVS